MCCQRFTCTVYLFTLFPLYWRKKYDIFTLFYNVVMYILSRVKKHLRFLVFLINSFAGLFTNLYMYEEQ